MPFLRFLLVFAALTRAAADPATPLVCYTDTFPPYVIRQGEAVSGIDVDMLRDVATKLGIKLEVRLMPWKRLEAELEKGAGSAIECAFSFSHTPDRETYLQFGKTPLHITAYTLFVRKELASKTTTLMDLYGSTIGVRRGFHLPDELQTAVKSGLVQIEETDQEEANFRKLNSGRLDAVLSNLDVGRYTLIRLGFGLKDIMPIQRPLTFLPTFLVFGGSKDQTALMARFDKALAQYQKSTAYRAVFDRYL